MCWCVSTASTSLQATLLCQAVALLVVSLTVMPLLAAFLCLYRLLPLQVQRLQS